jgi:hypothetical protein
MDWSEIEIEELKRLYEDNSNEDISKKMNRSLSSVINKANRMRLKKSKSYKSNNAIKRNKITGRDLNQKTISKIASKYKSRSEFQKMDPSAYKTARDLKILNEVCKHMISQSYSTPQLILFYLIKKIFENDEVIYNYKKLIYPYEVDVYVKDKIAFEYDGKRWHLNDKIDKTKLCLCKNITLIKIKENNRNHETDIKHQLINNIEIINKYKKINKNDILKLKVDYKEVYSDIIDISQIETELKKYNTLKDLRNNNLKLYHIIKKLDNYEDLVSKIKTRKKYTNQHIIETISKYEDLKSFIKNENPIYLFIKRNNLKDMESLLDKLKRKRKISLEDCLQFIKKNNIKTKYQLRKNDSSIYLWMKKNIGLQNINLYLT